MSVGPPLRRRKLAAVLSVDVAGYVRLTQADEEGTHRQMMACRTEVLAPAITQHSGRIVKGTGDGLLAEFDSAVDALLCATEAQSALLLRGAVARADRRLAFRMGVALGEIIVEPDDIYGNSVNLAARLQAEIEPGSICVSQAVYRETADRVGSSLVFENMGLRAMKGIAELVPAWRVRSGDSKALAPHLTIVAPPVGPMVAVLPFRVGPRSEDGDWIAQGLVDDLISSLGRSGAVPVIARDSSITSGSETSTTQEIARQLGAQYLVEGSLGIAGGRVRVSVRILEGSSARQLWAGRLERTVSDIFAVQDEIAMEVSGVLQSELSRREQERIASLPPTSDIDAYMLLQRGMWHHYRGTRGDTAAAQSLFREALAIDPDCARARAALAMAVISAADRGWWIAGSEQGLLDGMGIARDAIGSDPTCAEAWHALGQCQRLTERMLDESSASFAEAIALNPSYAGSRAALAWNLTARGQLREAIASVEAALRLSPRDPRMHHWLPALAEAAYLEHRYQDALHLTTRANAMRGTWSSYAYQAASLAQLGRMAEARTALAEVRRRKPNALRTMELSLKNFADQSMAEHILEGLRLAGSTDLGCTEPKADHRHLADPEIKSEPPLDANSQ